MKSAVRSGVSEVLLPLSSSFPQEKRHKAVATSADKIRFFIFVFILKVNIGTKIIKNTFISYIIFFYNQKIYLFLPWKYDFVNTYRVDEFIALAKKDTDKNFNLLGLAFEAGFNSKSSFNQVFKKIKGQTPSQFVNEG